jgi:hypothetical protein
MSMVSHLHHLFNTETCQAYIHSVALARSAPAMPQMSEPPRWSLGDVSLPAWTATLPL